MKKIGLSVVLVASLFVNTNAKNYSSSEVDELLNKIQTLETKLKQKTSEISQIQEDIDDIYDRVDENEFLASMNRIKWGAEFEMTNNFLKGETRNVDYSHTNVWTTKLRLTMESRVNDKTKFHGRLAMYKEWSDSTDDSLSDPLSGRKPNGSSVVYVERAYVDYSIKNNLIVTLGRQPSSDGPGMTLIQNTQRKATYPSLLFDGAADGIVLSYNVDKKSKINPVVRVAYGKGFQNHISFAPYSPNTAVDIDDLNVYGAFYEMSLPVANMGENLLIFSYVKATDFIGHPQVYSSPNNSNLGDMSLADVYFENNKAFGSKLNYFVSIGMSSPDSNGKTVNFGEMTGNQDVTLLDKKGYAYHIGMRYDMDKMKVGYEYNHGSKYWYSFTNGSGDLLNKLSTRGSVHDFYLLYQIDLNQFIRAGYTQIDYDYSMSGWHIGTPQKSNDNVKRTYMTYNLRF